MNIFNQFLCQVEKVSEKWPAVIDEYFCESVSGKMGDKRGSDGGIM